MTATSRGIGIGKHVEFVVCSVANRDLKTVFVHLRAIVRIRDFVQIYILLGKRARGRRAI